MLSKQELALALLKERGRKDPDLRTVYRVLLTNQEFLGKGQNFLVEENKSLQTKARALLEENKSLKACVRQIAQTIQEYKEMGR